VGAQARAKLLVSRHLVRWLAWQLDQWQPRLTGLRIRRPAIWGRATWLPALFQQ